MANIRKTNLHIIFGSLVLLLLFIAGCGGGQLDRKIQADDLNDPNPTIKILAAKWAGDNKDTSTIPQLVDLLGDEDTSVRFYAIAALKEITGTDNGFDYKSGPAVRAKAIDRWRQYIKDKGL
jgi:hypothetical protein